MKKIAIIVLLIAAFSAYMLSGCSIIKEGVTGDNQTASGGSGADATAQSLAVPAAFPIIGDWFGVYSGNQYLEFRFTADGKCELQPAAYPSDMYGPRYYGDYTWGGDNGNEISLDMYKGVSRQVDYGEGNVWDEWSDGGRDAASTGLTLTLHVYGGPMKTVAMRAMTAGIDTDGYTVVQMSAFLTLLSESVSGGGNTSPFIFGSEPYDQTEGKTKTPVVPDTLSDTAVRYYTTSELNVRCGPSTDFATYGTIPLGTPVDKIGEATGKSDWVFVLLADGGGWVNTGYISTSAPDQAQNAAPADASSADTAPAADAAQNTQSTE